MLGVNNVARQLQAAHLLFEQCARLKRQRRQPRRAHGRVPVRDRKPHPDLGHAPNAEQAHVHDIFAVTQLSLKAVLEQSAVSGCRTVALRDAQGCVGGYNLHRVRAIENERAVDVDQRPRVVAEQAPLMHARLIGQDKGREERRTQMVDDVVCAPRQISLRPAHEVPARHVAAEVSLLSFRRRERQNLVRHFHDGIHRRTPHARVLVFKVRQPDHLARQLVVERAQHDPGFEAIAGSHVTDQIVRRGHSLTRSSASHTG